MMRITAAGVAALTIAACVPTDQQTGGGRGALDGTYNQNAASCGAAVSETRMTIAANRITFYESACDVTDRKTSGSSTAMTLQCQAEGEQFTRQITVAPLTDGGLTVVNGDLALRYARCAG